MSLTTIELGVIGSLFLSTAVTVGIIRIVEEDDGVGKIVCGGNSMKWKVLLVASYLPVADLCRGAIAPLLIQKPSAFI